MKAKVKPAFQAQQVEDTVRFQLEYKKALKAQNKTFNQNGMTALLYCLRSPGFYSGLSNFVTFR